MRNLLTSALIFGGACLALVTPARAQSPACTDRATVLEQLADRWGEAVTVQALSAAGSLVEMWANPDTGTWTLTITGPEGATCLVGHGSDYTPINTPDGEGA